MASPRLRAIIITRSRTVSLSSARGSVVIVTSALAKSARMSRVSRSLMAETRSSGSVRLTPTARSTNSTPPAGNADENRNDQRCRRVSPAVAERDAGKADQDRDRRPHVGAEMQRIGGERFARGLARNAAQGAGAEEIHHDRAGDDDESCGGGFDRVRPRAVEPLHRFPDHRNAEREKKCRLGERGDALHFAMAV